MMYTWEKLGITNNKRGQHGLWVCKIDGVKRYRLQLAPIIPQGNSKGYTGPQIAVHMKREGMELEGLG